MPTLERDREQQTILRAGTNTTITDQGSIKTISETTAATASTGWTDDGANVRLTTAGDTVSIGTASPASGMKATVAGNVGPDADASRNIGSSILRWLDGWFNRILAGVGVNASGTGIISTAQQSAQASLFSEVAESAQFTYANWLVRRYRGTLGAKTNVVTGDYLATIEIQPDPARDRDWET